MGLAFSVQFEVFTVQFSVPLEVVYFRRETGTIVPVSSALRTVEQGQEVSLTSTGKPRGSAN